MGNIEEKNMTWTETPAEAFRKKLIADAEKSAKISQSSPLKSFLWHETLFFEFAVQFCTDLLPQVHID